MWDMGSSKLRASTVVIVALAAVAVAIIPVVFQAVAAEPILIGSVNDITGFAATFGTPEGDGQRLAVKAINDAGGVKGRPLQPLERDTQGDANRSVPYFEEPGSDPRLAAIAGFTTSGVTV
jgi:branched-chain amino acid transport system substrate-binding protein